LEKVYPVLEAMEKHDVPLLAHAEITDKNVDIFDREKAFIDLELAPIVRRFPNLRIVLEHATTRDAVQFVRSCGPQVAATLTAHHLLYNRNALFTGGLRPHYYCLPVLKKEQHRLALVRAATSGSPKFFLGTDSAPHAAALKEQSVCGAGCYTAPAALELYAEAFEAANALDKLEGFASHFGADFYGLPRNSGSVTLVRQPWALPESLPFGDAFIKPLRAGETLNWKLK
jgi:dihydroorotase